MNRMLGLGLMVLPLTCLFLDLSGAGGKDDDKLIKLFNGKDLSGFYTYLGPPAKAEKPYGKNNDPEKDFTVHDGMIHVSGKVFGAPHHREGVRELSPDRRVQMG